MGLGSFMYWGTEGQWDYSEMEKGVRYGQRVQAAGVPRRGGSDGQPVVFLCQFLPYSKSW